jgi:hypothetical protein
MQRSLVSLLGLLAAITAVGAAAQPRSTLKLDGVILRDALREIQKDSAWEFYIDHQPVADTHTEGPQARASFDFRDASLGKICRDLGAAYGYIPRRWGNRQINFESGKEKPRPSQHQFSRGGFSIVPVKVSRSLQADLDLGLERPIVQRTGSVALTVHPEQGDPDVIRGLENVQVITDQGPARSAGDEMLQRRNWSYNRVDEWDVTVPFTEVPPGARRIKLLTGEIVAYRSVKWAKAEIPFPPPEAPFEREVGPVRIAVSRIEHSPATGVKVQFEASWPLGTRLLGLDGEESAAPNLRLRSGQSVAMNWTAEGADEEEGLRKTKMECVVDQFEPDNPPAALVWDFTLQADPSLRIPFRLENVLLPALPGDQPVSPGPAETPRTGTIAGAVLLGDAPATAGELAFGLSRRGADGSWGPVRWQTVDVDGRGIGRVENLAPGAYRVQRTFRTRAGGALRPLAGKWLNGTVVVQVQAGKTVTLLPLKKVP